MNLITLILLILVISFLLAIRSMNDFRLPKEIRRLLKIKHIKGTILFFKDKVKHYRQ